MDNDFLDELNTPISRRQALIRAGAGLAATGLAAGGFAHSTTALHLSELATPPHGTDPMGGSVLTALQTSRSWINYGSAHPFDFAVGKNPVTEDQLQLELGMLFDFGFHKIVTNAMTYGMEALPRVAKEVGFRYVITKLWWADDDALEVVHKAIFRAEPGDEALERLRVEIERFQQAYGKPVSTGLHRDEWILYPQMATELGDFVFPNLQPWWAPIRNDPEVAAQWAVEVFELIQATPGMSEDRVIVA